MTPPQKKSGRLPGLPHPSTRKSTLYETFAWDGTFQNLQRKLDRKGNTINYTYDYQGHLTRKAYPDSSTVKYTYDLAGRLTQVVDPTGTYSFAYDNMGRLTQTTTSYTFLTGHNFTVSYTYDAASNRKTLVDPANGTTQYSYDTLNRLTGLNDFQSNNFAFQYDALSRRTQLTRPNGINTNYSYDNLSRLFSIAHQLSGTGTVDGASYTYDNAGNRLSKTDLRTSVTSNYTYDPIYQLTQVTQGTSTTESYTYDAAGNRLSSLGVSPYSYNSSNELTSTPSRVAHPSSCKS